MKIPTKILIFDLDLTITKRPTYMPFLLHAAPRIAPWRLNLQLLILPLLLGYALGLLDRKGLKQAMHRLMLGGRVDRAKVDEAAESFAAELVRGGVYGQAVMQIAAARSEGTRVMIATASHRFYVAAIAKALGITDVIATESVWDGDVLTADIPGENCYADAKSRMIEAYFTAQGIDRAASDISFYSDHISDLPSFEWADTPIAANPSANLRAVADQRGWTVVDWARQGG